MAAPFGTEEHFYRVYGEASVHNTLKDGDPIHTSKGTLETPVPVRYIAEAPAPIYEPGRPDDVRLQHAYQEKVIPLGIADPTVGLYSATDSSKGRVLTTTIEDARDEVLQGRKTLQDWDRAVADWRSGGGDKFRQEYEAELQKQ